VPLSDKSVWKLFAVVLNGTDESSRPAELLRVVGSTGEPRFVLELAMLRGPVTLFNRGVGRSDDEPLDAGLS
jgi:hypothetical protein